MSPLRLQLLLRGCLFCTSGLFTLRCILISASKTYETSRTCYNKMMQFRTQFKFLALRHRPHYQLKTRKNLLASCQLCSTSIIAHVFCRRCCHSSKTFLPHLVFYCVAFGMASDTRPVSSSLLFGERNQPTSHVSTTKAISK